MKSNAKGKPVCVVVGATSKWQADGRNTKLAHGKELDDKDLPVGAWQAEHAVDPVGSPTMGRRHP